MHRLFVDVGYELSEHQLRQHFAKYGVVSDVYLPKHSMGRNKGYAFVTFTSEQALSQALLDPQPVVHGIKLKVKRATPRPPGKLDTVSSPKVTATGMFGLPDARIFVEGISSPGVTEPQVQQHFAKWGPVLHAYFRPTQHSKDCIVTFDSYTDAKRACDQSDRMLDGRPVRSISLMVQSRVEQHRSISPPSDESEVTSGARYGQARKLRPNGPLTAADFAAYSDSGILADNAQMASQLEAANPSAFATWLHLEQLQQQLLANYAQDKFGGQFNTMQTQPTPQDMLPESFMIQPSASQAYSVPYLSSGYPSNVDSPQQYLDSMLSKLYSQSHQSSPELYSCYSQPQPPGKYNILRQQGSPPAPLDNSNPYLKGLSGAHPVLDHNQAGNTDHLRTLAQRAMAAAGNHAFTGRTDDQHRSESSDVPIPEHAQPTYSLPGWTPF